MRVDTRGASWLVAVLVLLAFALVSFGGTERASANPFEVPNPQLPPTNDPATQQDTADNAQSPLDREPLIHGYRNLVAPPPAVFDEPGDFAAQALKAPFRPGQRWIVSSDERYADGSVHPSIGPLAFDLSRIDGPDGGADVVAVADGKARKACLTQNQAIVLLDLANGDRFLYVHLDKRTLPSWMSANAWTDVQQGDRLGSLWVNDRPGLIRESSPDGCEMWTNGPHLHFEVPSVPQTIEGRTWDRRWPNILDRVTSTNDGDGGEPPPAATKKCAGRTVTIDVAVDGGIGTSGDDVILGTAGADRIEGRGGNDVICGAGGNDTILGNQGNDLIFGGLGNDRVQGGFGADVIHGQGGNDTLLGESDGDRIYGGFGDDRVLGGPGLDKAWGGPGIDTIEGGIGDDEIHGQGGNDILRGNPGNDRIWGGQGWDRLFGGWGNDTLWGGDGNDTLAGEPGRDTLWGGNHADTLNGGTGDPDRCYGQAGTGDRTIGGCELIGGVP